MKKITFCLALAMAAYFITPVWAGEERTQRTYTEAEQAFRKADIIPDGYLDRGEYDIYTYLTFQAMDKDRDHVISPEECLKNCFKGARGQGKADGAVMDMSSNAMDIDENGIVSDYEFLMFEREKFDQMDIDENEMLDKPEFCSVYDIMRPCVVSKLPG